MLILVVPNRQPFSIPERSFFFLCLGNEALPSLSPHLTFPPLHQLSFPLNTKCQWISLSFFLVLDFPDTQVLYLRTALFIIYLLFTFESTFMYFILFNLMLVTLSIYEQESQIP